MLSLTFAMLMRASLAEIPADAWNCRNQIEVWCAADGCAAAPPDQFTPMDIHASAGGALSVCAYSGCWETETAPIRAGGRILWAADGVAFSTSPDEAMNVDLTLLIVEKEGVGFVRAGGLATPLLCTRVSPKLQDPEE